MGQSIREIKNQDEYQGKVNKSKVSRSGPEGLYTRVADPGVFVGSRYGSRSGSKHMVGYGAGV